MDLFHLVFLLRILCSLHNFETVQGTNLKHDQKIYRVQESKLHLNLNKNMPFEDFSLKIVPPLSFLKTIKDVRVFSSRKPFKMYS